MSRPAATTIVQISDCHLFADPAARLFGISTRVRLQRAIEEIDRRNPAFDLLVVTGDTAHDEDRATYDVLAAELGDRVERLRIVPGNHDARDSLLSAFPDACDDVGGRVTFRAESAGWLLVGLDSQLPGEPAGELGSEQLDWLRTTLGRRPETATALFMHHPPIDVGSGWLDTIALRDAAALRSVLERHPQVEVVLTGHVHQEATDLLGRVPVLTTPAVGPQFRPHTERLEIEPGAPAFRVIELSPGGRWTTTLVRCDGGPGGAEV